MLQSKAIRITLLGGVLFMSTSCADDAYSELNTDGNKGGGYYEENDPSKTKNETAPLSE